MRSRKASVVRAAVLAGVLGVFVTGTGCRSGGAERSYPPAPAESPLSRVTKGMVREEVVSIMGEPTSTSIHNTGKIWIPFGGVFSGDLMHTILRYKGIGRVVLSSGAVSNISGSVSAVEYDPTEIGYHRQQ